MDFIPMAIGALYFLLLLGLSTFLLVRGVTHLFVGLFACGAFLHLIQSLGFVFLRQAPGGYSANARFFPILGAVGAFGTIVLAAAFVSLTMFLLKNKTP
jgi:hypothetical protein